MTTQWFDKKNLLLKYPDLESNIIFWLTKIFNLTEKIKENSSNFSLEVLEQSFSAPNEDEKKNPVFFQSEKFFIRKVLLKTAMLPIIFSRVMVPKSTYINYQKQFEMLGNASIGNTLLYCNAAVQRSNFEFSLITENDAIFQELKILEGLKLYKKKYWARRSVFLLPKGSLLITEVFLHYISL